MTTHKSVLGLLAIYIAAAVALAAGRTVLAIVLVLVFLAFDKALGRFRNAIAFMSSLIGPTARHAADHTERKDPK